jgi:aspartate aminotransferase
LINELNALQGQSTSNTTSIAQKAALAALEGPQDCVGEMLEKFKMRREYIVEAVNSIDGITCLKPDGAFYILPNIKALLSRKYKGETVGNDIRWSSLLLEDFKVALVPGTAFGAEGYVRISFAASQETIEKGVARIREFVGRLE